MSQVLIIDDSISITESLKHFFTSEGYEVFTAKNGVEGVELIDSLTPELVITDVIMPEKNGIEVACHVRNSHPDIKLIMMSSGGNISAEDHLDFGRKLGVKHVIAKPFTRTDILNKAHSVLTMN